MPPPPCVRSYPPPPPLLTDVISSARELIPLGGGMGADTAAILLGLKLSNSFPFLHRYITLIGGSHHLISQAGWNRCNLSIYLSIYHLSVCAYMRASILFFMSWVYLEFYSHTWST